MQVSILENLETLHKYYSKSLQTGRYVNTYIPGQPAALACGEYVPLKPAGAIKCKCKVDVYARRQRMRKVNKSFQSFDWPATMTQWNQKLFEVAFKVLHPYKRFVRNFYQNCFHVQVNFFQKHLFLHQLTHNMTRDCSLISSVHENYKLRTCCVHQLFFVLTFKTIYVHNMF